jgi:hypothetical protein
LERQTLWIFEIYALAECFACCQLDQSIHTRALAHTTSSEHEVDTEQREGGQEQQKEEKDADACEAKSTKSSLSPNLFAVASENAFCRKRAQICLDRSLKVPPLLLSLPSLSSDSSL